MTEKIKAAVSQAIADGSIRRRTGCRWGSLSYRKNHGELQLQVELVANTCVIAALAHLPSCTAKSVTLRGPRAVEDWQQAERVVVEAISALQAIVAPTDLLSFFETKKTETWSVYATQPELDRAKELVKSALKGSSVLVLP